MPIDSQYISMYFTVGLVEVGIKSEVSSQWEIEECDSECKHKNRFIRVLLKRE